MDAALVAALRNVLGEAGLVDSGSRLVPYESDGLAMLRHTPEMVLLPRTTQEAARSMRLLAGAGVPLVGRGAGTGLSGGATPVEGGVVISLARMRDVLEVDPAGRLARVQAGVVNADLTRAAAPHGLFYAPDPSSQMACTIGGNVAENSGGPHCFMHGSTTRHILGLVIVCADGEVLDLSQPQPDPSGYDLIGSFVGSEGTLGLVTEVTVKLTRVPPVIETLLAVFPGLDGACDSVSDMIAARLEPSALEILDRLTIQAVEDSVFAAGYPKTAEAVLLVELEGSALEVDVTSKEVHAILEQRGAIELRKARDPLERRKLWAGRKGAFGAMGRIAPDLYVADAVVPRTKLRQMVARTAEICRERNLRLATVFHAGDGNLHPNICYDRRDLDEVERVLEAGRMILQECIAAGGSLTGEHGVGLEKLEGMDMLFKQADLATMCRMRDAWDPERRMNPGKLLPVRACREVRTNPLPSIEARDEAAGAES